MMPSPSADAAPDTTRRLLWLAGIAYTLVYLIFYPPIYSTMDESAYLGMAYTLLHHTLYADVAGISTVFAFPVGAHQIVMYPPGMSALLMLGGAIGWKSLFLLNLAAHLGTFAIVAATLRRLRLPVWFSLLYLLHPTAVLYSRTVMTDIPTGLLIGGAFLLYLKRHHFEAGALLGIALLLRTASLVAGPLLCLGCLLDVSFDAALNESNRMGGTADGLVNAAKDETTNFFTNLPRRIVAAIKVGLGWLPFFALAYYYQAIPQQGGWSKFPLLKVHAFPHGVQTYGTFLLVCYPLMLFAPFFYRRAGKAALRCLVFGFLLLYCCYEFTDTFSGKFEAFVLGQRYLLTMLPLLVVAYAAMLTDFAANRVSLPTRRALAAAVVAGLGILCVAAQFKHEQFLRRNAALQRSLIATVQPTDLVVCTGQTGKFFSPGWGGARTYATFSPQTGRDIDAALKSGRRVLYAQWFREKLSDVSRESDPTTELERRYTLRPLRPEERHGLPDDVGVFQVEERGK